MSKGKVNPSASIESVEESGGELTATITPQMAIQCARASLLLSSLRPPTLRQTDLDAQVIHASVDLFSRYILLRLLHLASDLYIFPTQILIHAEICFLISNYSRSKYQCIMLLQFCTTFL